MPQCCSERHLARIGTAITYQSAATGMLSDACPSWFIISAILMRSARSPRFEQLVLLEMLTRQA